MKILLIEDEPDLGAIIQKSLSYHQYVVDWAMDGKSGWEYLTLARDTYSLAIIDWMLPKISGIELCQKLRAEKYTLPILMLTAKDRMEDKIMGLDAGADDYLVKPFGMEELLARLRALYRRAPTFQPDKLQVGNFRLDYGNNAIVIINSVETELSINLTAKEFQLLEYLMQQNQLFNRTRIQLTGFYAIAIGLITLLSGYGVHLVMIRSFERIETGDICK